MNAKILVPLATMLAAGAVAVGSGATFSSQSGNTISAVTAGTLTQSNSKAGQAIFNLANIKPGDTVNGTLTLTNTGSLPANFSIIESASVNQFANKPAPNAAVNNLSLTITNTTKNTTVYSGNFGDLVDDVPVALGTSAWAAGEANTYRFSVTLATDAPNVDQGKTASAVYSWSAVQSSTPTVTNQ